ncbi:hypothetical protein GM658_27110 [Pseudoduganella eburnea]|uniref:Putative zinc-finger domain-containing protein n=1 Tax=Massilia eburnea TaxID=1776165 RepID=A0A6L6QQB2_9BURK|nr:zf-HC2 domain-containing protein [Massilia eburnea]MTW14291.1 hypothetical protein [Massilia eburnea]
MNGRIVNLDVAVHNAMQEQMPLYLAGRLDEAASARLQQHLQSCALCQEELAWQRKLRSASPPLAEGLDMERALARLAPQLAETAAAPAAPAMPALPWWRRAAANEARWLRWALAAQCVLIAGLVLLLARPDATPRYALLGSPAQAQANVVVVFQPGTRESELRGILQANGARLVGGPTETDAYLLAVPGGQRDQILLRLRTEASIKLAEPLGGKGDGGGP